MEFTEIAPNTWEVIANYWGQRVLLATVLCPVVKDCALVTMNPEAKHLPLGELNKMIEACQKLAQGKVEMRTVGDKRFFIVL